MLMRARERESESEAYKRKRRVATSSDPSPKLFVTVSSSFSGNLTSPRCVTKTQPLSSLTMAPACARPVSPEMMLPALSSPPSLDVPVTRLIIDRQILFDIYLGRYFLTISES